MDKCPESNAQPETRRSRAIESIATITVFFTAGCIGAVATALQLRGSLSHVIIVFLAFFVCVMLTGVSILLYIVVLKQQRRGWLRAANITTGVLLLLALQAPSFVYGRRLLQRDIQNAKTFCEQLVPPLDRYFRESGTYPNDIAVVLPTHVTTPPVLGDHFYASHGEYFDFNFTDPGWFFSGYSFSSHDRHWEHWD